MRLLIDNDFYIKLELAGLLDRTLAVLKCTLSDCRRLPALVPQFRGKKWRTRYGEGPCRILREKAEQIEIAPEPTTHWLGQLAGNPAFDPGEALLLALAAETPLLCLGTADKRAMRAVPSVPGLVTAMAGKLVAIEHVCLTLCETWGVGEIQRCLQPTLAFDKQLQSCFSCDTEAAVREGLRSYASSYEAEVGASMFWRPLGRAPADGDSPALPPPCIPSGALRPCAACEGYGRRVVDVALWRYRTTPCDRCEGAGRMTLAQFRLCLDDNKTPKGEVLGRGPTPALHRAGR